MNVLAVVWFAAAGVGLVAVLLAVLLPGIRREALVVAGAACALAGVLGIFSIGIVFIGLAAVCFTKANKLAQARRLSAQPPPPGSS